MPHEWKIDQTSSIPRSSKITQISDFMFENIPSGNPAAALFRIARRKIAKELRVLSTDFLQVVARLPK
jgi:hypothetical protein